jgi:hypothetical protein
VSQIEGLRCVPFPLLGCGLAVGNRADSEGALQESASSAPGIEATLCRLPRTLAKLWGAAPAAAKRHRGQAGSCGNPSHRATGFDHALSNRMLLTWCLCRMQSTPSVFFLCSHVRLLHTYA